MALDMQQPRQGTCLLACKPIENALKDYEKLFDGGMSNQAYISIAKTSIAEFLHFFQCKRKQFAYYLHNPDCSLLGIPQTPLLVDLLERTILLENGKTLINLRQKLGGPGTTLVETDIVVIQVNGIT
jgi:hypothetical protein